MSAQSASREVATWATLVLGPDRLDVSVYGRCWMGFDKRVACVLTRVELDGRDILDGLSDQHKRDLECRLACEYVAEPVRKGATGVHDAHDDGPGAA